MSDLYNQIMSQRGSVESLMARLPGFRGYLDNKVRRTADRLLRDYIADELTLRINRLVEVEKHILNDGGLSLMSVTASAKSKLQHFRDQVKTAAPGYSGLFEQVKLTAEDMERIYTFDEAIIRYVDQFDDRLHTLENTVTDKGDIKAAIAELDKLTIEAQEAFSLRDDILTHLGKSV
ncbi:MAG: hypothetical protein R3E39_07210 [Anaerolineae bacterium]